MFQLYSILKEHQERKDQTVSQEEIDIASGKVALNSSMAVDFVKQPEKKTENIPKAFYQQEVRAMVHVPYFTTISITQTYI